jgi:4-alpha-methyl-delta7-sterol-4alpha-methyl oxidase
MLDFDLQEFWVTALRQHGEYAMTTYLPFSVIVGSYILFNLPLVILDLWSPAFIRKYKIQQDKVVTPALLYKCCKRLAFNYFCVMLPLVLISFPIFKFVGMHASEQLPPLKLALMQIACFMLIEDFTHFCFHWWLHRPSVYPVIHAIHHEFRSPFGLTASYAHPVEVIALGFCTFCGPMLYAPHVAVFLAWICLRQALAIETHCGYEFPFSPNRWLPFCGGASFHDFHHLVINGAYSSNFTFWDTLFGTDDVYWVKRADREKQDKLKSH